MAHSNAMHSPSMIDAASALFQRSGSDSSGREAGQRTNAAFSAQQANAMARRLEQIQNAQGTAMPMPEVVPPRIAESAMPVAQPPGRFDTLSLIMACLLSAAAGAAIMWLATPYEPALSPVPAPATVIQAVRDTAPPPPVATEIERPAAVTDEQNILSQLAAWREAWASRDVDAYLAAYSSGFTPADGSSREAWAATRKARLSSGSGISLNIDGVTVERIDSQTYRASFLQDYASGSYREKARPKTLLLAREASGWKIIDERQTEAARPRS